MPFHINMFEYKGKPFKDGLQAYIFAPNKKMRDEEIGRFIGSALNDLDVRVKKNSAVAQFQDKIYCVPFNVALLPKEVPLRESSFNWKRVSGPKNLVPTDDEDREIIRRLTARAIAKRQIERGWFVEQYKFAYHWSFNLSKQLYTQLMDVYPGFVFRPYVYENGSCAIMTDPRFKFVPKKNLRNLIEDLAQKNTKSEKIKLMFQNEFVIDACPVVECPYRKNPSSRCRLKGAGKRRKLAQLDFSKRPSQASIGSLIEYHRKESICPFYGRIADFIEDRPPVALIEIIGKKELLEYPIERLRQELRLHRLDKYQRLLVMKYIQPPMTRRWKITENFISYVDEIQIGRSILLQLIRSFVEAGTKNKPWERYSCFEEIPLRFGNDACSHVAFSGLKNNGPYDLNGKNRRRFGSLRIMICNLSTRLSGENIKRFYHNLVNGFNRRSRFEGMKSLFKLEIPKFSEDLLLSDIHEIHELSPRERPDIVIVLASQIGRQKIEGYETFKQKLTEKGISSQFVLEGKLGPRITPGKYASYLKNLALAAYYKAGGIPWVLSRSIGDNSCYIGLAMITRRDITFMSVQIFDSIGLWLGGWTEFLNKNEYSDRLVNRIKEAQEIYAKEKGKLPDRTVLHKDGEMWSDIELQPMIDCFDSSFVCVSIKKTTLPRMYDPKARTDYIVQRGSCVQIDNNIALLATSGPPHPIRGSQRPVLVEVKSPKKNDSTIMNVSKEIFNLSLIFGGYRLAVISKPITTYFASKALRLTSKYGIVESPLLWRKAWFV